MGYGSFVKIVPFESLGKVSFSHSVATMANSRFDTIHQRDGHVPHDGISCAYSCIGCKKCTKNLETCIRVLEEQVQVQVQVQVQNRIPVLQSQVGTCTQIQV